MISFFFGKKKKKKKKFMSLVYIRKKNLISLCYTLSIILSFVLLSTEEPRIFGREG